MMHGRLAIRPATLDDRSHLRSAIVELHEHERGLHSSRLPGEETADAYLDWMLAEVERSGAVLIAEAGSVFIGFAAGWIVEDNVIEETPDSNRFGLVSYIWVLAPLSRPSHRDPASRCVERAPLPRRCPAHPLERARGEPHRPGCLRACGVHAV